MVMPDGLSSHRVLGGVALAVMVVVAGVVALALAPKPPRPVPSPSAAPLPSATAPSPAVLARCLGTPAQTWFPASLASPAARPVSASGYSTVSDPAIHRVVLFGGIDDYGSTWLWNGTRWTPAPTTAHPPGRFGAAAAYDPESRQVMVYGGRLRGGDVVCDTWAWSGTGWVELDRGTAQLPPGEGAQLGWDAISRQMILVTRGGAGLTTWVWGHGWVRQPHGDVPAGWASSLVFDPASRSMLLVTLSGANLGTAATWRWEGAAWHPVLSPTPSGVASTAADPLTGRPVLLAYPGGTASSGALWTWTGEAWQLLPGSSVPSGDTSQIVADPSRGRLLLFGPITQSSQQEPQAVHVWAWTASAWQRLG